MIKSDNYVSSINGQELKIDYQNNYYILWNKTLYIPQIKIKFTSTTPTTPKSHSYLVKMSLGSQQGLTAYWCHTLPVINRIHEPSFSTSLYTSASLDPAGSSPRKFQLMDFGSLCIRRKSLRSIQFVLQLRSEPAADVTSKFLNGFFIIFVTYKTRQCHQQYCPDEHLFHLCLAFCITESHLLM